MTDLVRDVAADVRPPDFDTLVRRARRRRARQRAAGIAAAATVAAAVAVGASLLRPSNDARPMPTGPSPTTAVSPTVTPTVSPTAAGPPTDAASIVAQGMLVGYAVDGRGGLMTKWQVCDQAPEDSRCTYAMRVTIPEPLHPSHTWRARQEDDPLGGSSGFVQTGWSGRVSDVRVVIGDGLGLVTPIASGSLKPGVLLLAGTSRLALRVVDPATSTTWSVSAGCLAGQTGWMAATVSSDGTLWAVPQPAGAQHVFDAGRAAPTTVCSSADGHHWHVSFSVPFDPQAVPGMLISAGQDVALVMTGMGSATIMPVTAMWSTTDGAHWSRAPAPPFAQVDSLAATSGGVLFAAADDGTLYRSTDWRTFARIATNTKANELQPNGATVAARLASTQPGLVTIADDGTVNPWPTPLR